MIDNELDNIIGLAAKYPVINKVGIFGSYARGEQTKKSDIDILYDYDIEDNNDSSFVLEILNYYDDIAQEFSKFNLDFDYVSYKGVMDSNDAKIRENIISEVRWVYERKAQT